MAGGGVQVVVGEDAEGAGHEGEGEPISCIEEGEDVDSELERQDLTAHLEPGLIGMVPSFRLTPHKPGSIVLFPLHLHVYKKNRNKIQNKNPKNRNKTQQKREKRTR